MGLGKTGLDIVAKRQKTSSLNLERELNKVKRPELDESDDGHSRFFVPSGSGWQ
jgi:hypothetical protein